MLIRLCLNKYKGMFMYNANKNTCFLYKKKIATRSKTKSYLKTDVAYRVSINDFCLFNKGGLSNNTHITFYL